MELLDSKPPNAPRLSLKIVSVCTECVIFVSFVLLSRSDRLEKGVELMDSKAPDVPQLLSVCTDCVISASPILQLCHAVTAKRRVRS
jgi:hypothetical protein